MKFSLFIKLALGPCLINLKFNSENIGKHKHDVRLEKHHATKKAMQQRNMMQAIAKKLRQ